MADDFFGTKKNLYLCSITGFCEKAVAKVEYGKKYDFTAYNTKIVFFKKKWKILNLMPIKTSSNCACAWWSMPTEC